MSRPCRCDCPDWTLDDTGDELVMKPSARTIARQFIITAIAAALIGGMIWTWGIPPGSRRLDRQRDLIAGLDEQIDQLRGRLRRLRSSATGPTGTTGALIDNTQQRIDVLVQDRDREQAKLERMRASLGPVGDTMYWVGFGLLIVAGVGLPLSGFAERIILRSGEDHRFHVIKRFSLGFSRHYDAREFTRMVVTVRRLAVRGRHTGVQDAGWLWSVLLLDGRTPRVEIRAAHETSLPPRMTQLNRRVRLVVRFLQRTLNLKPEGPIETDIMNITQTVGGTTYRTRTRRHG